MKNWKAFEKDCFQYLVRTYGHICSFEQLGESVSTNSDIKVSPAKKPPFFMETKERLAQCGQFVLFADEEHKSFTYSSGNKSPLNQYSQTIIDHMNCHFVSFAEAGTRGQEIQLPDSVFYGWIKDYYVSQNVRFFITKAAEHIVFPIEKLEEYFNVTAKYRVKKSGSSDPSRRNIAEINGILKKEGYHFQLITDGKKLYVRTDKDISGKKLPGEKFTYLFNPAEHGFYHIRRLSNTQNANVIFSITLKQEQQATDLLAFESSIQ